MSTRTVYKYKITPLSQLKNAWLIPFMLVLFIPLNYYSGAMHLDPQETLTISTCCFLLYLIPTAIIHQNYYTTNKNDTLIYNSDSKEFLFTSHCIDYHFLSDDINRVVKHVSLTKYNRLTQDYSHMDIELNNGDKYIVTSLLVPGLELPIPKEKVILDRDIFSLAKGNSVQLKTSG